MTGRLHWLGIRWLVGFGGMAWWMSGHAGTVVLVTR